MKIHVIRQRATEKEIREMLEELTTYIKLAVDIQREVLAGGGEYHADCEEAFSKTGVDKKTSGGLTGILIQRRWHLGL